MHKQQQRCDSPCKHWAKYYSCISHILVSKRCALVVYFKHYKYIFKKMYLNYCIVLKIYHINEIKGLLSGLKESALS